MPESHSADQMWIDGNDTRDFNLLLDSTRGAIPSFQSVSLRPTFGRATCTVLQTGVYMDMYILIHVCIPRSPHPPDPRAASARVLTEPRFSSSPQKLARPMSFSDALSYIRAQGRAILPRPLETLLRPFM